MIPNIYPVIHDQLHGQLGARIYSELYDILYLLQPGLESWGRQCSDTIGFRGYLWDAIWFSSDSTLQHLITECDVVKSMVEQISSMQSVMYIELSLDRVQWR